MIIGIKGKAGSGKDTIGFLMLDLLHRSSFKCSSLAFANPVKDLAASLTGNRRSLFDEQDFKKYSCFSLTDGRTYSIHHIPKGHDVITIRELLQKLGTEAMQGTFGKNVWVNQIFKEIDNTQYLDIHLITDVRFKHEYDAIKNRNGMIIEVVNPNLVSTDKHQSEIDLDNVKADYTIINDWENNPGGLDKQVYELVQQIKRQQGNN